MAERLIVGKEEVHAWIHSRSGLVWVADFHGIAREVDGKIVAAVGFDHHQGTSCSFHIAADPRGLSRQLLFHAFATPFLQWEYKVLLGIVQAGNEASNHIATRLGFYKWATLPDAHPSGALEFYRMTKQECPWLDTRKINERRRKSSRCSGPVRADQAG